MDQAEFEGDLRREGYEPRAASLEANTRNVAHAHGFDARLLILEGDITIIRGDDRQTFRAGETCEVPAGELHEEHVGPYGVRYIAGRRSRSS